MIKFLSTIDEPKGKKALEYVSLTGGELVLSKIKGGR